MNGQGRRTRVNEVQVKDEATMMEPRKGSLNNGSNGQRSPYKEKRGSRYNCNCRDEVIGLLSGYIEWPASRKERVVVMRCQIKIITKRL